MRGITRLLVISLMVLPFSLLAQGDWEKNDRRSMESMVFDVVGDKEIKLPPAARMFDPIPPQPYQRVNKELTYSFENYFYSAEAISLRLRPRPLAAVPVEKLYGSYVRAGFGNYATPFLDLYTANKRQTEFSYGMRLNYINSFNGPVDKDNSAQGQMGASIFGGVYGDKITLTGEAAFDRNSLHFYGYDPGTDVDASDIEQFYNGVSLKGGFRNTSPEDDFQINGMVGLNYQNNFFEAKETDIYVDVVTSLQVLEEAWTHVEGSFSTISRNDNAAVSFPQSYINQNRTFFTAKGGFSYQLDALKLKGMLRLDYQSDTLAGEKGIHLFPVASVEYKLNSNSMLTAGIDGGIEKNTWNSVSDENLFLDEGQYIAGTILQNRLYANFSATISPELSLNAGARISNYKNSYYFNNSAADPSRFVLQYDTGSVKVTNPYASLSFNKDEKYRVNLGLDYFGYKMAELDEAWHRPEYTVTLNSSFALVDKFRLNFDAYLLGGIKAEESAQTIELDSVIDLNIGVEYFTGSRMSIFIKGMNLTGNNYMIYNRYPVKGIQVLGGVSYKF